MVDLWIQHSNLAPGGFGRVMREDQFKDAIAVVTDDHETRRMTVNRLTLENGRLRTALRETWKLVHTRTPPNMVAVYHYQRDFDQIRAIIRPFIKP